MEIDGETTMTTIQEETGAFSKGELKQGLESPIGDTDHVVGSGIEDDTPLVQMVPTRLRSRLRKASGKPVIIPTDEPPSAPSIAVPIRVTRSIQKVLDDSLLAFSSRKSEYARGKVVPPSNPIIIEDDTVKLSKRKRKCTNDASTSRPWKQVPKCVPSKRSVKTRLFDESGSDGENNDGVDDIGSNSEVKNKKKKIATGGRPSMQSRILNFAGRRVLRGRVITGVGGVEMGELLLLLKAQGWTELFLQGTSRRKIGREETREFYINAVCSPSSITSVVRGVSLTLDSAVIANILGVPNEGWCSYEKRDWPPLDGLPSALEISRLFSNDPTLEIHTRVDKGAMIPLHQLLFDVVHKMILPREQKRMEANFLDLTIMQCLLSKVKINLPQLMVCHMNRLSIQDKRRHALGYGFWLGAIFEHFGVPVQAWQEQTMKDVLGVVDAAAMPTLKRGISASEQRLRAQLASKDQEIAALRASHRAVVDNLHISYGLEYAGLVDENTKLKTDLALAQSALEKEKATNTACLQGLYEMLKNAPSSTSHPPPSV